MGIAWQPGVLLWSCLSLGGCLWTGTNPPQPVPPPATAPPPLQYRTYSLPQGTAHVLRIPRQGRFRVVPAIAPSVASLEEFAQQSGAIAVLNGGFFDPGNQQSTAYVLIQGKQVADPQQNQQLVQNPSLAPYLEKIWNRTEFRRYQCGQTVQYGFAPHRQLPPPGCQLIDALGGGPRLLPNLTAVPEGFLDYAQGQVIRDPIGINQPNARTAIGITRQGDLLWVMVAQDRTRPNSSGIALPDLARWLKTLGVEQALNLDGGSSSALYYQGKTFYGKVNESGESVQRPVKSVLLILENPR